ncbi:MAG: phosphotyrosine protein phosphatase [Candidatus Aminicenantes bacterium]|nr:phosphotyrosine protein phosphatase [Candidatus Aminicenantes bacterium]NIN19860.1 phosphotyrosine protein phosphatase [Candidatus Aminicenantes bacterium]NIN43736.1 phosphotyrosine protein phosphatase [Candidatus Aminicenantes bacterium]NIN86486.1 phosphotyrosine protein phosphatase [Candidatus Aminicenantes bacterium]NIQ68649.1 phosphotyrosine protein phosphatase [Candidatus Aminicenantes bacterium]
MTTDRSLPVIKILFVCTANKMRSKTAEELYKNDERFMVKSAGVADFAEVPVNLELLIWADYIVVMEEMHLEWLRQYYPITYANKKNFCLDIPDLYDFMEPELVFQIRQKFETLYQKEIKKGEDDT